MEPTYAVPSVLSAGVATTAAPVATVHTSTPLPIATPYTLESVDPTIKIPVDVMTGDDEMSPCVLNDHRTATPGPMGPVYADTPVWCEFTPNWLTVLTEGDGDGVTEGVTDMYSDRDDVDDGDALIDPDCVSVEDTVTVEVHVTVELPDDVADAEAVHDADSDGEADKLTLCVPEPDRVPDAVNVLDCVPVRVVDPEGVTDADALHDGEGVALGLATANRCEPTVTYTAPVAPTATEDVEAPPGTNDHATSPLVPFNPTTAPSLLPTITVPKLSTAAAPSNTSPPV